MEEVEIYFLEKIKVFSRLG